MKKNKSELLPHYFMPTGKVEFGKVWGTTITQTKCKYCGLTYWVGQAVYRKNNCPVLVKRREQEDERQRLEAESRSLEAGKKNLP